MSLRAATACVAALLAAALVLPGAPRAQPAGQAAPAQDQAGENAPGGDETLPIPPVPPRISEGPGYEACLDMLTTDPSGADTLAATLAPRAGAEAAAHCHALAQVELGNSEAGAALLDKLAAGSTAPAASRAEVFAQASQAWSMAGDNAHAWDSASRALALSPDDPDLRIGRAIAGLALQRYADANDDLTQALALDPKRADALILRATARRNLGDLKGAAADIAAACAEDPDNADALLERGIIRQRTGDLAGARTDWSRVVELAPDTPTGDLAQQNLELLDAGPRQ
jgi:tetratricopeptide (TPR) repeat protein